MKRVLVALSVGLVGTSTLAAPPPGLVSGAHVGPPRSVATQPGSGPIVTFDVERAALRVLGDPSDLVTTQARSSLTGEHVRFGQLAPDGTRVAGAEVSVHFVGRAPRLRVGIVWSNVQRPLALTGQRRFGAGEAGAFAAAVSGGGSVLFVEEAALPLVPRSPSDVRAGWRVVIEQPAHEWEVWVDGETGAASVVRDLRRTVDGTGMVYRPNPLTTSGDTTLTDSMDADSATLTALREMVVIQGLDGSGMLLGDYADAVNRFGRLTEPSLVYNYTRQQDEFEEVMAYWGIDTAQRHLQGLGYTGATAILDRPFHIQANGIAADNSYFSPTADEIVLGRGGVDDGEDADVIRHEYGHAMHEDIVPGWGTTLEAGSIGEGFGDLVAALHPNGSTVSVERACIAPWDAVSYSPPMPPIPCLRRTDGEKHYPEHMHGEVHDDGEIFAGSMWDVVQDTGLGDALGYQLIVESHFALAPDASFADFAGSLLAADAALHGGAHDTTIRRVLTWDGLLRDLTPPGAFVGTIYSVPFSVASGGPLGHEIDEQQTVTLTGALALRLHFATFDMEAHPSCLDGQCDNVYLYDAAGRLYAILGGSLGAFDSVVIPGETVIVRWVTDVSVASAGFTIDRVDFTTPSSTVADAAPIDAELPPPDAEVLPADANVAVADANVAAADANVAAPDANLAAPDADLAAPDANADPADASPGTPDAAASMGDGGGGAPDGATEAPGDSSGCDCRAGRGGVPAGGAGILVALALLGGRRWLSRSSPRRRGGRPRPRS